MSRPPAALGADLGATWLRVRLTGGGRPPSRARLPAVDWRRLPAALRALLRSRGLERVDAAVVGSTRLGRAADRARLARALRPLARRARALPDFELAHSAAFGGGPGVLLVASTGSVAFARGPRSAARAGGWGPLLGDEGSAFWLGREAARDPVLRARLRLPHPLALARAKDPVRAAAALAPRVLAAAARLRRAALLREEAAAALAGLAREAAARAGLPRPRAVALHGGLWKDASLRRLVLRRLGAREPAAPRPRAEDEAARLAAGLALTRRRRGR